MASQRVLLLSIAGDLADAIWHDVCRWSDACEQVEAGAWSPDDWPESTKCEVDHFVTKLSAEAYLPPVLYRSEHVDCWSMGDVFEWALVKRNPDKCRRLVTNLHEIIATWVLCSEQIVIDPDDDHDETVWLSTHINEAMAAWNVYAEKRLVVLVRIVLGGMWEDSEVIDSLRGLPSWWTGEQPSD